MSKKQHNGKQGKAGTQDVLPFVRSPVGFCKALDPDVLEYHTKEKFLRKKKAGF